LEIEDGKLTTEDLDVEDLGWRTQNGLLKIED
jgi:hypothetical protein